MGLRSALLALGGLLLASACAVTQPSPEATLPPAATATVTLPPPTTAATWPATFTPDATTAPTKRPSTTPPPSWTPTGTPLPSPSATPCGETAGRVLEGTFPSATQGWNPPYRIYLPPCYGLEDMLYPALYLFHGNIYSESHWDDLGIDEAADEGISSGLYPPFIIVMPFGAEIANNSSGGDNSFEGVVLNDLIPFIEDQYCVWSEPAGRAIGGLSRGAYWSLEIAFRQPELFIAVGGHSAAIGPAIAGPAYHPLSTGQNPKLAELNIYLDIGEDDWLWDGALDLHRVLTAVEVPHVWQVNPGSHEDAYWREHTTDYLLWYTSYFGSISEFPSAGGRDCPSLNSN